MPEQASSFPPVDPARELALDWQIGRVFSQFDTSQNDPPPRSVVLLGVAAGALEGVIVGVVHGGFDCVILSVLLGGVIGVYASVIAWRLRRNVRQMVLSLLLGVAVETAGGFLIVLFAPMFVQLNIGGVIASCVGGFVFSFPLLAAMQLIYREILGAFRGLIFGMIVSAIFFMALMGLLAVPEMVPAFGTALAVVIGCILGVLMGIVFGFFIGPVVGAVAAALTNVNQRTILPTYGGLMAAVGLGLAGWFTGEAVGHGFGVAGVYLGVGYGALAGIKLGRLVAARSLLRPLDEDERASKILPLLVLSDPRELADGAEIQLLLSYLLLLAIRRQFRQVCMEPRPNEYAVVIQDPSCDFGPPLPLRAGKGLEQILKGLPGIDLHKGQVQIRIGRCQVELHLRFEPTPYGERIIMNYRPDADAAEQAGQISKQFLFIRRARKWFESQMRLGKPREPFAPIATVFPESASS